MAERIVLDKKLKMTGEVAFAGVDRASKRNVVVLKLTQEQTDKLAEIISEPNVSFKNIPLKEQEDKTTNLKTQTDFPIPIFVNGEEDPEFDIKTIGKGSNVTVSFKLTESTNKLKKKEISAVAYLTGIEINDLEERVEYNPFEDEEVEEL